MESAAANHIVVEFLIFIKLKLYNFGGNDILLECERERLIMDIMLNRLFIYLPYLQQELGQDDYSIQWRSFTFWFLRCFLYLR